MQISTLSFVSRADTCTGRSFESLKVAPFRDRDEKVQLSNLKGIYGFEPKKKEFDSLHLFTVRQFESIAVV